MCTCGSGFSGNLPFNMSAQAYTGSCTGCGRTVSPHSQRCCVPPTPRVRQRARAMLALVPGSWASILDRKRTQAPAHVCQHFHISIAVVSCPLNASGAPLCSCNAGYSGALSFSSAGRTWSGTCSGTDVACSLTCSCCMPTQRYRSAIVHVLGRVHPWHCAVQYDNAVVQHDMYRYVFTAVLIVY